MNDRKVKHLMQFSTSQLDSAGISAKHITKVDNLFCKDGSQIKSSSWILHKIKKLNEVLPKKKKERKKII